MPITDQNGLIAGRATRQRARFQKASIANVTAGAITALWRSTGPLPAQPAIPGAAVVCDKTTAGALINQVNPTAPAILYVDTLSAAGTVAGSLVLYDRLIHSGGLNGTLATAQTVNTPALPAAARSGATAGTQVEWYLSCYTDLGATGVTATVTYTNQAGTTGRTTTVAVPATWRAGRELQIFPAGGDTGIRSIESVQLSATTGSAGSFGVTCRRHMCRLDLPIANIGNTREAILDDVGDNACLELIFESSGTTSGDIRGAVTLVTG